MIALNLNAYDCCRRTYLSPHLVPSRLPQDVEALDGLVKSEDQSYDAQYTPYEVDIPRDVADTPASSPYNPFRSIPSPVGPPPPQAAYPAVPASPTPPNASPTSHPRPGSTSPSSFRPAPGLYPYRCTSSSTYARSPARRRDAARGPEVTVRPRRACRPRAQGAPGGSTRGAQIYG